MGIGSWQPIGKMDVERSDVIHEGFSPENKKAEEILTDEFINEIDTLNLPIIQFKKHTGDYIKMSDIAPFYNKKMGDRALTRQAIEMRRDKLIQEGRDILTDGSNYYLNSLDIDLLKGLYSPSLRERTGMVDFMNRTNELEEYIQSRDNLNPEIDTGHIEIIEEGE